MADERVALITALKEALKQGDGQETAMVRYIEVRVKVPPVHLSDTKAAFGSYYERHQVERDVTVDSRRLPRYVEERGRERQLGSFLLQGAIRHIQNLSELNFVWFLLTQALIPERDRASLARIWNEHVHMLVISSRYPVFNDLDFQTYLLDKQLNPLQRVAA